VRFAAQSIQDEYVEVLQQWKANLGDVAHIGEIGGVAEAVACDLLPAMGYRDAAEAGSEEIESCPRGGVDAMDMDACAGWVAVRFAEGVVEDAFDVVCGFVVGVDGQIAICVEAEGTQIVEAHDMVGVTVCVKDRIDTTNTLSQSLCMEVRAGIDEHGVTVVGETDGWPRAAIVRIGRGADRAVAAEGRHPHGGAGAQKGERRLHGLANDAGADWARLAGRLGSRGACQRLGDFQECHA
jgi:hypothetical protein